MHDQEFKEAEAAVVGDWVEPGVVHCDVGHLRINLGCQCILSRDFPRHLGLDPIDHGVDSEQGDQRHANPRHLHRERSFQLNCWPVALLSFRPWK